MKKNPTDEMMAYIKANYEYNPDTGDLWREGKKCGQGIVVSIGHENGAQTYNTRAYRIAWLIAYNVWPESFIDHIDGNRRNNRLNNLRLASSGQNQRNQRKVRHETTSKYKGVKLVGKRWRAYITYNYKMLHIGYFNTEEVAAKAYDRMARELHGEFACLNFGTNNALSRLDDNVLPCSERYFLSLM